MGKSLIRLALLLAGLCAVVWPAAWAAPATDNLYPTVLGPGATNCHNDPDGGDGRVTCHTDNATVTWYMDSAGTYMLEDPDRADVRAAIQNEFEPTNLDTVYDSSPTFSGGAETDIVYQEGSTNLDADADGVTWCENAVGLPDRWRCDQQYIRIRGNGAYNTRIACHETGHAIGLLHGTNALPELSNHDNRLGCMTTNPIETADLGSNNVQNINGAWDAP